VSHYERRLGISVSEWDAVYSPGYNPPSPSGNIHLCPASIRATFTAEGIRFEASGKEERYRPPEVAERPPFQPSGVFVVGVPDRPIYSLAHLGAALEELRKRRGGPS
jgi:hypothetical protein